MPAVQTGDSPADLDSAPVVRPESEQHAALKPSHTLLIGELDNGDNLVREYVRGLSLGGGIGGILYCKESGNFYYYHYDGSGNVTSVTDGDGEEVAIYEYDSFGNVLTEAGSLANEFRFSTKQADKRGQLIDFGFRWYDPEIGRFTQRDPIGIAGGLNLYAYCDGNAVNLIEPWGFFSWPGTSGPFCGTFELPDVDWHSFESAGRQIGGGALTGAVKGAWKSAWEGGNIGTGAISGGTSGGIKTAFGNAFDGYVRTPSVKGFVGAGGSLLGYVGGNLVTGGNISGKEGAKLTVKGGLKTGIGDLLPGASGGMLAGELALAPILGSLEMLEDLLKEKDNRDKEIACRIQASDEDDYGPTRDFPMPIDARPGNVNYMVGEVFGVS